MAKREFNWIGYDVAVPASLAQRMRTFVTAPHGAIELALAAEAPSTVQVEIKLPDLAEYPTPRSKAKILLESAAEVEHALMVQYLYAAYSLKASDEVDPANADVLDETIESSWPQTLRAIAREEMGHFMTVQNLLMLLGLDPNFEREDSPFREDLYPFRLKLQPLTQASLAKYVVAEAPGDAEGIREIMDIAEDKTGSTINRVGILYGLLGAVFSRQDQIAGGATGHPEWDDIVRVIAKAAYKQDGVREHWHLSDGDFHIETLSRQADPDDWQVGQLRVHRVADRGRQRTPSAISGSRAKVRRAAVRSPISNASSGYSRSFQSPKCGFPPGQYRLSRRSTLLRTNERAAGRSSPMRDTRCCWVSSIITYMHPQTCAASSSAGSSPKCVRGWGLSRES
jgi:Ferritin-like